MIKVLIVDDSPFMRMRIRKLLESDHDIKIAGIARNGLEAVEKAARLKPDVITMDITMPVMTGLEAVEKIMAQNPTPIIMVSALTRFGAKDTIAALNKGAIDYVCKDELDTPALLNKIHAAVHAQKLQMHQIQEATPLMPSASNQKPKPPSPETPENNFSIVALGISTGGPKALGYLIPRISSKIPVGIVIAQHMPPVFTKSLSEHLDSISKVRVVEAENGQKIQPGVIYICPGGMHMSIETEGIITLYPKSRFDYIYVPSVDMLMSSIGDTYGPRSLCVIMTGMGADGTAGVKAAKKHGCYVLAQSKTTCTIYGMPRSIIENNLHDEIVDLENIADRINQLCLAE